MLEVYDLIEDKTSYSKEFAACLKKYLDIFPVTGRSLEPFFKVESDKIKRTCKDVLSGYREWEQPEYADDRVLLAKNIVECLSIDETSLRDDLFTFLTNKDGHGKNGTLVGVPFFSWFWHFPKNVIE